MINSLRKLKSFFSIDKETIKKNPKLSKLMPHIFLIMAILSFFLGVSAYITTSYVSNDLNNIDRLSLADLKKYEANIRIQEIFIHNSEITQIFLSTLKIILTTFFIGLGFLTLSYRKLFKAYTKLVFNE